METDVHRRLDSEFQGNKAKKWCDRRSSLAGTSCHPNFQSSALWWLLPEVQSWLLRTDLREPSALNKACYWVDYPLPSRISSSPSLWPCWEKDQLLLVPVRSLHCPPSFDKYAHRVKVISFQGLREVKGREGARWSRNRHLCNVAAGEASENSAKFRRLWMLSPGICKENAGISLQSRSCCYWWCWVDSVHQ